MTRVLPDANDIIVWKLNETSGAYRNTGTYLPNNSSTDLTITNTVDRNGTGLFNSPCANFPGTTNFPVGSSATRNYIAGAKTINPAPPLTVSCWVNLRSYTSANNQEFVVKEYRDSSIISSWTTPFVSIYIGTTTTNGGGDWLISTALNNTTQVNFTITDFLIPLGVWSHIGFTHDGSAIRAYLNGCQCIYYSGSTQLKTVASAGISYTDGIDGYGLWRAGAITATGSANKEEPNAMIQDIRVANIIRPLTYFKNVYKVGVLPLNLSPLIQYYKLRAYDTSCITPTSVTWVDTQISLTNAPAFPCSGPYTAPEVLYSWMQ